MHTRSKLLSKSGRAHIAEQEGLIELIAVE
jgi:hypothetical protein